MRIKTSGTRITGVQSRTQPSLGRASLGVLQGTKEYKDEQDKKRRFEEVKKEFSNIEGIDYEDKYKEKYEGVDSDLKEYFETPEQVKERLSKDKEWIKYKEDYANYLKQKAKYDAYQTEVNAIRKAEKAYDKKISYYWYKGTPVYKYLKQMWEDGARAKASLRDYVDKFEKENPSEKLIVDWNNLKIKGVESGFFQQSFNYPNYQKELLKIKKQAQEVKQPIFETKQSVIPPTIVKDIKNDALSKSYGNDNVLSRVLDTRNSNNISSIGNISDYKKGLQDKKEIYKKVSEYLPAPSDWETYKKYVKEKLPITGTLDWLSDKAKTLLDREKQEERDFSRLQDVEIIGSGLRMIPYFTPGGGYILIAEGTEGFISKEGKQDINDIQTSLKKEGYSDNVSKVISYMPNTLKIALGYFSSPLWTKTKGYIKTLGRQEINPKDIVPKDVMSGKESFPLADKEKHLELFKDSPYKLPGQKEASMYHASPEKFWDDITKVKGSESELPGLYGSYGVSPHFLKTPGSSAKGDIIDYLYGDVIYGTSKPGVMNIIPDEFASNKAVKVNGKWVWTKPVEPGTAYIPEIKREVEAILPPDTELIKIASKYYFKWNGARVPIDEFTTIASKLNPAEIAKIAKLNKLSQTLGSYSSSYGGLGSGLSYNPMLSGIGGISSSYSDNYDNYSGSSYYETETPSRGVPKAGETFSYPEYNPRIESPRDYIESPSYPSPYKESYNYQPEYPEFPQKVTGEKGIIPLIQFRRGRNVKAFTPIILVNGKEVHTNQFYPNMEEAKIEGKYIVDETPYEKFTIKSRIVPKNIIRRTNKINDRRFKFIRNGNVWNERKRYRKDRGGESFNWMGLMGGIRRDY